MSPSKTWRWLTGTNPNARLSDLRRQSSSGDMATTSTTAMILSTMKNLSTGQRPLPTPSTRPVTAPLTRSSSNGASRNNSGRDDFCAPLSPYSENPQQKRFASKNRRCIRKFIAAASILTFVQIASHFFWAVGSHLGGYSVVDIDEYLQGQYRAYHPRPWLWNDDSANNQHLRHPRRHYDHRQFWGRRSKAEEDKMRKIEEQDEQQSESLLQGRGREWTLNVKEGTISPKHASNLLLGVSQEKALVLVKRGTEQQLFFPELLDLREGRRTTASLTAHTEEKDITVGRKYGNDKNLAGPWRFDEAVVHSRRRYSDKRQPEAVKVSYAHHNFIRLERAHVNDRDENLVLEVANWQVEDGVPLNFVGGTHLPTSPTYIRGRAAYPKTGTHHHSRAAVSGRDWTINDDGTLSPKSDPTLVVGVGRPRVVLVSRKNQASMENALMFDSLEQLAATSSGSGSGVPLTLRGRPEYALGKLRRHSAWAGPWRYVEGSFEHVDEAPRFRFVENKFLYVDSNDDASQNGNNDSTDPHKNRSWSLDYGHLLPNQHQPQKQKEQHHYTLDVAFWNLEEGSTVNLVGTSRGPVSSPKSKNIEEASSATASHGPIGKRSSSFTEKKVVPVGDGVPVGVSSLENKDDDDEEGKENEDEEEKENEEDDGDDDDDDDGDDDDDDDEWGMEEEDGAGKGNFGPRSSTESDNSEADDGSTQPQQGETSQVEDETATTESTVAWNVSATGFVDYADEEDPSSLMEDSASEEEGIVKDGYHAATLTQEEVGDENEEGSDEGWADTSSSGKDDTSSSEKDEDEDGVLDTSASVPSESSNPKTDAVSVTQKARRPADYSSDKNHSSPDMASDYGSDKGNLKLSRGIISTAK